MASGKHIPCGPCSYDDITNEARRWCTKCEEGLCEDCEKAHRRSKSSRNHKVISMEDYRKIEHVSVSQVCDHHGENVEWFCKGHDEVLCVVCVPSKHKACSDVIPISVNSRNARQSSALSDLEDTIEGNLRNIKQCIKNRESATKEIEKQELDVKTMILETRTKINGQLDRLQEKLLQELKSTTYTCKSEYMKILQKLKSTEKMLDKLREQTIHMKQFSSDIQVFLGTRQVNLQILSEMKSIKSEIDASKDYELKVVVHSKLEKFEHEVEEFGRTKVSECLAKLDFKDPKIDQAQIGINVPTSKSISDIQLQLIKSFQMQNTNSLNNVTGCVILPNSHLLIANSTEENKLIEYSETGEHLRNIPVSHKPGHIAVIDLHSIVMTYGNAPFVAIMNNTRFNVENKISLPQENMGGHVSHMDGRLYVTYVNGVQVMDISGEQLYTYKPDAKGIGCIITNKQNMFYADYKTKQVHCCCLNGKEVWKFESDSLIFPYDITVDSNQNVYALDYVFNSLTIIQPDGRDSKILLTKSDGLNNPQCVFYDKHKNALLICNKGGKVALYKVV